jgi:hypothetical protein
MDNYANLKPEEVYGLLAERVFILCTPNDPENCLPAQTGDLGHKDCNGSGKRWLLRKPCEGDLYYGHRVLPIENTEDSDWYSVLTNTKEDNAKVARLVRKALARENPLDDWLWDALNKNGVGDTATREMAYSVVQTNIPHPPCKGTGYVFNDATDSIPDAIAALGWSFEGGWQATHYNQEWNMTRPAGYSFYLFAPPSTVPGGMSFEVHIEVEQGFTNMSLCLGILLLRAFDKLRAWDKQQQESQDV